MGFIENFWFIWYPWISFWADSLFLQILMLYIFILFIMSTQVYYTLLYLFCIVIYCGLFLGFYQADFFTGFLWIIEFTIVFISLLLLFYLNVIGTSINYNIKKNKFYFIYGAIICFFFCLNNLSLVFFNNSLPIVFTPLILWVDYYEAVFNLNVNDFLALTISYYYLNFLIFLVIGVMLLVASVICVNLNLFQKSIKLHQVGNLANSFNNLEEYLNFYFLRVQELSTQSMQSPVLKSFKRNK